MLKIGSKVRVKENAYEGSDDPDDFLVRGKVGKIVFSSAPDEWEVQTEDDDFLILTTDEIEEIEGE